MKEERLERDPALPLRTPKKREVLPDVLSMASSSGSSPSRAAATCSR